MLTRAVRWGDKAQNYTKTKSQALAYHHRTLFFQPLDPRYRLEDDDDVVHAVLRHAELRSELVAIPNCAECLTGL